MAYNEKLAERVRTALAEIPKVEEKRMFRGVAFMVNGKMCITVGDDEIMCRIDPAQHDKAIEKNGYRTMVMKGREYRGYVLVTEEGRKTKKDFEYWIALALDFNEKAKASPKKKK
jgi:TfoX/Sxy family transcriptional regulator of competence genes